MEQTLRALERLEGASLSTEVRCACDLPTKAPDHLIPEARFVEVIDQLRERLPRERSEEVLGWGGALTAEYVARHRIGGAAKWLLRALPPRASLPLLLRAIRRHAWTFAGAGRFDFEGPFPGTLILEDAPTCRRAQAGGHLCSYYQAAFEGLLSLAAPGIQVRETECQALGADRCRFSITLAPPASPLS